MILNDLNQQKKLSDLETQSFKRHGVWSTLDLKIYGLSSEAQRIKSGYIFFAIKGIRSHGAQFALRAIERGAILIVTDSEGMTILTNKKTKLPIIVVDNPRQKLAQYAAKWNEIQPRTQIAVTGTNGKTSVCHFTQQIWDNLGHRSASIGTLGVRGELVLELKNTTPEPIVLHQILRELTLKKVDFVSMEASSHGLDQFRLDGVILKAAAFTNFSRDHLDYHSSQDDYLASKCMLFDRVLPTGQLVVLNIDDPCAQMIKRVSENRGHKIITVGTHETADFRICDHRLNSDGQTINISHCGKTKVLHLPFIGDFQAINVLMAGALAISLGAPSKKVFEILPKLESVPGRMELVGIKKPQGGRIYVDYAHSPDALQSALKALRSHTIGKLLLVFGAGGERDFGKRSLMGKIAQESADLVYITDDNPRNEVPQKIRSEILISCPSAIEIPDRAEAILTAINNVQEGDVLLIAGKGHESGQIIGDDIFPFNDKEFVSMSLTSLEGKVI